MDEFKTNSPEVSAAGKNLEMEFEPERKSSKKWIILSVLFILAAILGVVISNIFSKPKETVFSMLDIYLENMAEEKLGEEIDKKKYEGLNKYNHMGYKNVSGITIKEQADKEEMSLDDYKKTYGLPKDMPEDTYFDAAFNMMPIKVRLAIDEGETDFVTFKKNFKVPDYIEINTKPGNLIERFKALFEKKKPVILEITEDLPWGIVYDELTLEVVVGSDKFDQFKKEYNLDDKVNLSTKYKEVRSIIEEEKIKNRDEAKSEIQEPEVPIEDEPVIDVTEGGVEQDPAVEVPEEPMLDAIAEEVPPQATPENGGDVQ